MRPGRVRCDRLRGGVDGRKDLQVGKSKEDTVQQHEGTTTPTFTAIILSSPGPLPAACPPDAGLGCPLTSSPSIE